MTNEEALAKINSRLTFGMKPGLRRIKELLGELGDPQKQLKFAHVAGTNGKGTTCALLSSALREAGYTVGLYTSPYVEDFRERFQIGGEKISPQELVEEVELLSPIAEAHDAAGDTVTEFEFITALAFHWFARRKCDIVVLEVGLGGRFDATNAIDAPEVAVIASISLDHTAILGDTLEQIAFEKAGIVKPGGRLVLYPWQGPGVVETISRICGERGAQLLFPQREYKILEESLSGTTFQAGGETLRTPFLGEHQVRNAGKAPGLCQGLSPRPDGDSLHPAPVPAGRGPQPGLRRRPERRPGALCAPAEGGHHRDDGGQGQPRGLAAGGAPLLQDRHPGAGEPPVPAGGGPGPGGRGVLPPGGPRPDLRGGHRPGHEGPGAGGRPHRLRVLLPGGGDPGTAEGQAGEFAVVTGFPKMRGKAFVE